MKKILAVLLFLAFSFTAVPALAQNISKVAGVYDSTAYTKWGAAVAIGNSSTGAQTITVCPAIQSLPDGRQFQPLAPANGVFPTFTIAPGSSSAETLAETGYALVSAPSGYSASQQCANVTATFSNTHAASLSPFQVITGDYGIQEAINDAALNGGGLVFWRIDPGIVTLSTSGPNTNLGSVNIPTRSDIMSATAKVTTTIGTCAGGWSLGFTSGTEFTAANTTLTAGTTTDSSTIKTPLAFTAAATVPIATCTTSNASAGAIHAVFTGYKVVPPAN